MRCGHNFFLCLIAFAKLEDPLGGSSSSSKDLAGNPLLVRPGEAEAVSKKKERELRNWKYILSRLTRDSDLSKSAANLGDFLDRIGSAFSVLYCTVVSKVLICINLGVSDF